MFERYTEKARRVIFFARYEAGQFGSPYIETEHLLPALLREASGIFTAVSDKPLEIEAIRKELSTRFPTRQKVSTSVDLPLSHECKRALAYGAEEAGRLNHKHIGSEHLLLGLLREHDCVAGEMLRRFGITVERLRASVVRNPPVEDGTAIRYEPDVLGTALTGLPRERRDAAARVISALAEQAVTITVATERESSTIRFPTTEPAKEPSRE
jgi:ATP-dependent Clp protease ATP-binding subunit ClpC